MAPVRRTVVFQVDRASRRLKSLWGPVSAEYDHRENLRFLLVQYGQTLNEVGIEAEQETRSSKSQTDPSWEHVDPARLDVVWCCDVRTSDCSCSIWPAKVLSFPAAKESLYVAGTPGSSTEDDLRSCVAQDPRGECRMKPWLAMTIGSCIFRPSFMKLGQCYVLRKAMRLVEVMLNAGFRPAASGGIFLREIFATRRLRRSLDRIRASGG